VGETDFCAGDQPGMADVYLVPQIFNALRLRVDMAPYPRLYDIYRRCQHLEAFARAHPDEQPDRPPA
ncbi:MAG: maleylacetoacetate isomerase, partial [Pseudomonadales bacterium]